MDVAPRFYKLLALSTLFTLWTLSTLFNCLNTILTALHCLNSSMYAHILLGKVRTLLEWADEQWQKSWMEWSEYPLDCREY